jgi:hypothetical protein
VVAVPPNDAYQVTVAGAGFHGTATAGVMVANDNRQVDFISGQASGILDFNPLTVSALTASPPGAVPDRHRPYAAAPAGITLSRSVTEFTSSTPAASGTDDRSST